MYPLYPHILGIGQVGVLGGWSLPWGRNHGPKIRCSSREFGGDARSPTGLGGGHPGSSGVGWKNLQKKKEKINFFPPLEYFGGVKADLKQPPFMSI